MYYIMAKQQNKDITQQQTQIKEYALMISTYNRISKLMEKKYMPLCTKGKEILDDLQ